MREFFFGKSETLLQSLFDGMLKSLFSGLVVASASIFMLGILETKFATVQKRSAFLHMKNNTLSKILTDTIEQYNSLGCVRDPAFLVQVDCKNKLDQTISLLRRERYLLTSLLSDQKFSSIELTTLAAERLRDIQSVDLANHGKRLSDEFSNSFTEMIKELAKLYE